MKRKSGTKGIAKGKAFQAEGKVHVKSLRQNMSVAEQG